MAKDPSSRLIGLMITELEGGYGNSIWRAALKELKRSGDSLLIFPARGLDAPQGFHFQHNIVNEYVSPRIIDALLMCSSSLQSFLDRGVYDTFLTRFTSLPTAHINARVEGSSSFSIDCVPGIEELTRHLLDDHGYTRFAYLAGPSLNLEANDRLGAFKRALSERGIDLAPDHLIQGDFSRHSGRQATASLLSRSGLDFQALVCANDEMAMGAIQALEEAGLCVPEDVAVTGFDDIPDAALGQIPLSTVRQPLWEMASLAAIQVSKLARGGEPGLHRLYASKAVIRRSCGCRSSGHESIPLSAPNPAHNWDEASQAFLGECRSEFARLGPIETGYPQGLPRVFEAFRQGDSSDFLAALDEAVVAQEGSPLSEDFWHSILNALFTVVHGLPGDSFRRSALLQQARSYVSGFFERQFAARMIGGSRALREAQEAINRLGAATTMEELATLLRAELPSLGLDRLFVSRFPAPFRHQRLEAFSIPEESELFIAVDSHGHDLLPPPEGRRFESLALLPPGLLRGEAGSASLIKPLFFMEEHYGTMVMGFSQDLSEVYETLCLQLGSIYHSLLLMENLADLNHRYEALSYHDELTGLYNRRGLQVMSEKTLSLVARSGLGGAVFFADVDGLKSVNDNYGHKAGDECLRAAAKVLGQTFRQSDIIARIGGDEFCVLASDYRPDKASEALERLEASIAEYNAHSGSVFSLSLSAGAYHFEAQDGLDLSQLLARADSVAYEVKRAKQAGR